jgi:hypothetical protein
VITTEIKVYSERATKARLNQGSKPNLCSSKGFLEGYKLLKHKDKNGSSLNGTQQIVSPISSLMTPTGQAQHAASELLASVLDSIIHILGELSLAIYFCIFWNMMYSDLLVLELKRSCIYEVYLTKFTIRESLHCWGAAGIKIFSTWGQHKYTQGSSFCC